MNRKLYILALIVSTSFSSLKTFAQEDKIKFGAYSRAIQETNRLGKDDTANADHTSSGHVLVDLGINVNPDKNTEIQAILRLKSELGGFFGAGANAQLRQLYVKGLVGKIVGYQVGDIYLKLSPFTYFNNYAEGNVNEARIFSDLRNDYAYYENLNRGNYWWQQGAHTDFTLATGGKAIKAIRFDAFFVRNKTADLAILQPGLFQAGGRVLVNPTGNFNLGFNYINLFGVGSTISSDKSVMNPVFSVEPNVVIDKGNYKLRFFGEGAFAQLNHTNDVTDPVVHPDYSDVAIKAAAGIDLKKGLLFEAGYRHVGADFYSAGAQSKRIDFTSTPVIFPIYGNRLVPVQFRTVSEFDIIRDASIYNPTIQTALMIYDPRLSNALPYGEATPNRTGPWVEAGYKDSLEKIKVNLHSEFLSNVEGEKGRDKKSYMLVRGTVDLNVGKFIGFKKKLLVNAGYKLETAKRSAVGADNVDFTSHLVDAGLEIELLKRLDLMLGSKMVVGDGSETMSVRNEYNELSDPTALNFSSVGTMMGYGLKYRFTKSTYLTAMYNTYNFNNKLTGVDQPLPYSINQMMFFFNLSF